MSTKAEVLAESRAKVEGLRFPGANEYIGPPSYQAALLRALEVLRVRLMLRDPDALLMVGVFDILVPDNLGAVPDPLA